VSCAVSARPVNEPSARLICNPPAGAPDGPTLSAMVHPRSEAIPVLSPAGGLQMSRADRAGDEVFGHEPVMAPEIVELLTATPEGLVLDATVGGGGHAAALLSSSPGLHLIGLDRDPAAVSAARNSLAAFGGRARVVKGRFDALAQILDEEAPDEPLVAVLFDLGVSSFQFDEGGRGFSYRFDAPLDMRMDPGDMETAADLVNTWTEEALAALIADNGEVRFSRRIARAIVSHRPVQSTVELAELVRAAIPTAARHRGGHPAKRVFQALRIAVNGELDLLGPALDEALAVLAPKGRCAVLSYHSGEDRIVKSRFAQAASGWCTCPPALPCVCGAVPAVRLLNRGARMPSADEVARNPRSSSARLRAVERLEGPLVRPGLQSSSSSTSGRTTLGTGSKRRSQRRGDGHAR
jgi:16S rRNA (cytosine1402-N4)-methyltransferase